MSRDLNLTQAALAATLLTACVTGCGSDASSAGAAHDGQAPLYLISTSVLTDDLSTSYLTVVDSLAAGPQLQLDNALEFSNGGRAFGAPKDGVVYVTSYEDPTLTEVKVRADGTLDKGRVLSFLNQGISDTTGANVLYFISPTKAYFVSQETQEIVVWDPSEMAVIKAIPLEIPILPSSTFVRFYPQPIVVGDKLLLISSESDDNDIYAPPVITVVDYEHDRVLSNERESRCPGLGTSALDARGDRYFAQDGYAVGVHFKFPDKAPAPCLLRIRAGETSFDPGWSRALDTDLGTQIWTGATPGPDGKFYVQAIAEDAPAVVAAEDPYGVSVAEPWSWYSMSDGDAEPRRVTGDSPPTPPLFPDMLVGDTRYVTIWDETDTTLLDLTSASAPRNALPVRGFVYNIVQVR